MRNFTRSEAEHISSIGVWSTPFCDIPLPSHVEQKLRPRIDRRTEEGRRPA
jgi:hypothetical protein